MTGLKYQNAGYIEALITALDQDTETEQKEMTPGEALIARLKASLETAKASHRPVLKRVKKKRITSKVFV